MPRRSAVGLDAVAELGNLAHAFWRAAAGKRKRPEVIAFAARLDQELAFLSDEIRDGTVRVGRGTTFFVHDPKRRAIHAPVFRERVLHHALMAHVAPVLDRALVDDTFACRVGKGTLAAIRRAQQHATRQPWYVKVDVASFFHSVDHDVLRQLLRRRLKDRGVLALMDRILAAHHYGPGRGLPIGSLTSQHFANTYLAPLDRLLLEQLRVGAMVRYMDDVVWWCSSRHEALASLRDVTEFVRSRLHLELKPATQIQRSSLGLPLCGFRVYPYRLALGLRRRRRFAAARRRWESAWREGRVDSRQLQLGTSAALAIVAHADTTSWRGEQLLRVPPVEA